MLVPIIIAVSVFALIVFICVIVYFWWDKQQNITYQTQRVEQAVSMKSLGYSETPVTHDKDKDKKEIDSTIRRDTRMSSIPFLNIFLGRFFAVGTRHIMNLIEQSGLKIKAGEFLLLMLCLSVIGTVVVDMFMHIKFVGLALGFLSILILKILIAKRKQDFLVQLPQALDMLSNDLRAGSDVQSGLKHLSEEFKAPLGEEFAKVVMEINLGLSLNEALTNLTNRINLVDVQILCTGIIINRELGGNLSELIVTISNTVRERFKLEGMIKALTAENKMTSIILLVLPIGLYFILNMIAPDAYGSFATDPLGSKVLIGCGISMTIGFIIIKKVTTMEA